MTMQMFHKTVRVCSALGMLFCSMSFLLLVSCERSNRQTVNTTLIDTVAEEKSSNETDSDLQSKSQANLPYVLPIDSLWTHYDVVWTTSGRCNRPAIFDDDSSKNLLYGFYTILDHCSGRTSNVADIVVSYRKNKSWGSSDTTQKIRIIHVKDRLFALPVAPFHVGDPLKCIKDKAALKKGTYY